MIPYQTQTIYTFCRVCECRLHTPEEWLVGRCSLHASGHASPTSVEPDWNAILEAIDASDPRKDGRTMKRES